MKKTTRIIICAALFCIAAGIICAVVGAIAGGKPNNMPAVKDMQNNIRYYEYNYGSNSRGGYYDDYYNDYYDDYFDYYYGDYYNRGNEGGI